MLRVHDNSTGQIKGMVAAICVLAILLAGAVALQGTEKKRQQQTPSSAAPTKKQILDNLDLSRIVWPNPPAIARIKFLSQFYGEKRETQQARKKTGWMDKLAGVTAGEKNPNETRFFQLVRPYGVGVDSKGRVYTIDEKVLAVFIYDPENQKVDLIKNGVHARFSLPTGLTLDDADNLFVSDTNMHHVLVFNKEHKIVASISDGMMRPAGLAVDNENRFLYVADSEREQVLVFDADPPYKLLRTIGQPTGKENNMDSGRFARPTNVALDKDGNVYVSDTMNNRIQIFDADGNFISMFGKAGDGPGYFARPKGIGVDSDGHVWVADAVQDRVQVFTREGQLLIWMGGHGLLPGMFSTVAGLTIDNHHRVFTTEQYPGRIQIFRYVADEEARAELAKHDKEAAEKKKSGTPSAKEAGQAKAEATTPKQ